jgi:hydrogen peroxide-dependent heme synthase
VSGARHGRWAILKETTAAMSAEPLVPSEGWGVLHLFFHLRRDLLAEAKGAARDFTARVDAFDADADQQVLAFSVLGQKADLGLMVLGPDLTALDRLAIELASSPFGQLLVPAASYISITELSEYTPTVEDESQRLVAEEGLEAGSSEHTKALRAFETRMAEYAEHRLHPRLPRRRILCFYPMSKRRGADANWYALPFEERKRLMSGHARVGRSFRGRVLQLITGSVGLDDWEWGVTLLADDPKALRDIVYEMRFDEVSARYAEFGPFVTGFIMSPSELLRHHGAL